jgi:glycosyltransferase involved in cell wall biosynthesis
MNKCPTNQVCFVHPRFGRDGTPILELLERFDVYGKSMFESSGGQLSQLKVLAGITELDFRSIDSNEYPFVQILRVSNPTNNFLFFALKSYFKLKQNGVKAGLFIAGDFWVGGLCTVILQSIYRPTCRTQITLHGNPVSGADNRISVGNSLRKFVFRILLRNFSSIRLVSQNLIGLLDFDSLRLSKKVIVSPVYMPVIEPSVAVPGVSKCITVLGRLHVERNPIEALSIFRKIVADDPLVQLNLLGDGPLRGEVVDFCESKLPDGSYTYWGRTPHGDAMDVLASSSVLVSSALEEGYGLTIREALLLNVPVVAHRNTETADLSTSWPKIMSTYESESEAVELVRGYLAKPPHKSEFSRFRTSLQVEMARDLEILTGSWLALALRPISSS